MKIDLLIRNGTIVTPKGKLIGSIGVHMGKIQYVGTDDSAYSADEIIDATGKIILPGLIDNHVHFREPGPSEEENFLTGTRSAAAGGVTTVFEHPVDLPPTTTYERFCQKKESLKDKSYVDYGLWAGVTPDNLDQINLMWQAGACAFKGFICGSDPNYPPIDDGTLLDAMRICSSLDAMIAIHAENDEINKHELGKYTQKKNYGLTDHAYSRPLISELEAIQRCIAFAKDANVHLHILHLSAAGGANLIAHARQKGYPITIETCPHYFLLDTDNMDEIGVYAKCNPPIRDRQNQTHLIAALKSGKIDTIVSDHSPCTLEGKTCGISDFRYAMPGINGLEVGLILLIDRCVKTGILDYEIIAKTMSENVAKLMRIYPKKGCISVGSDADFVIINPAKSWTIQKENLQTLNKWSPFDGWNVNVMIETTILRGVKIFNLGEFPVGSKYGYFINGYGAMRK